MCNSCASLAGLVLCFVACFILLVIAPLAILLAYWVEVISVAVLCWCIIKTVDYCCRLTMTWCQWRVKEGKRTEPVASGRQAREGRHRSSIQVPIVELHCCRSIVNYPDVFSNGDSLCMPCKGAIISKIKHAIKLKTSPARLAKLLQPSSAFCFNLQPMTAYRPGIDGTPSLLAS